jgi:hypothetical protein
MKIRPVGAEFHADGQTDMTQLMVAFHNFTNMPKTHLTYIKKCNVKTYQCTDYKVCVL